MLHLLSVAFITIHSFVLINFSVHFLFIPGTIAVFKNYQKIEVMIATLKIPVSRFLRKIQILRILKNTSYNFCLKKVL